MNSLTASPPNIIFECSDIKHDIGLMVTTTKSNDYDDKCKNHFQLQLYDGYNDVL